MRRSATQLKLGATNKPDYDYTNFGLLFPQNNASEIAYTIYQLPHVYKLGSDIYPHVHFVQSGADQPTFKIDYRWYENEGDPTIGFTTLTFSTFLYTYTSGSILQIAYSSAISGSGISSLSSFLEVKLYRDDNVVTGDVLVKELDVHYQIDDWGARQEYIK